jgi:hypothetical protein
MNMLRNRKIWVGLSLVAGVGAAAAAPHEPVRTFLADTGKAEGGGGDFPGGKFSDVLKKVLAGEGGEGGIGMSKMQGGKLTIPALSGAHIKEALSGNTLRRDNEFALHFAPQGTFKGWEIKWDEVDAARCTKDAGKEYSLEEGVCWFSTTVQYPTGTWTMQGDKLCTAPTLVTAAEDNKCVTMALILDKLAAFNDKGDMLGKGSTLLPGEKFEKSLKK